MMVCLYVVTVCNILYKANGINDVALNKKYTFVYLYICVWLFLTLTSMLVPKGLKLSLFGRATYFILTTYATFTTRDSMKYWEIPDTGTYFSRTLAKAIALFHYNLNTKSHIFAGLCLP